MAQILAHRGNVHGPSPDSENHLLTVGRALSRGFGLEIDIRRTPEGRFYISHDPLTDPQGPRAEAYFDEIRRFPKAVVALNIKEEGHEAEILELLRRTGVLDQVFLFDMELIEARPGAMAARFRDLEPRAHIAARVSDRGESISRALDIPAASIIWLDEFDRPWATKRDVVTLREAGKHVFAVSPDLHGFPHAQTHARWLDFMAWGVDGICTDWCADLAKLVADRRTRKGRVA